MLIPIMVGLAAATIYALTLQSQKQKQKQTSVPDPGTLVYHLGDPQSLEQFKRALSSATQNLPAASLLNGRYDAPTSMAWAAFVHAMHTLSQQSGTPLPAFYQTIRGVNYPTAAGLAALASYATLNHDRVNPRNGVDYMLRYWPQLYAFGVHVSEGKAAVVKLPI